MGIVTTAREILEQKRNEGWNNAQIADAIGYSRTAVSLYMNDKYPAANADNLEAAVLDEFANQLICPFLQTALSSAECADFSIRAMPESSPLAFKHWAACQSCEHNSNRGDQTDG